MAPRLLVAGSNTGSRPRGRCGIADTAGGGAEPVRFYVFFRGGVHCPATTSTSTSPSLPTCCRAILPGCLWLQLLGNSEVLVRFLLAKGSVLTDTNRLW